MGITKREEQEVGCWKHMLYFDSCGGVAECLGVVKMVLTKVSDAKP